MSPAYVTVNDLPFIIISNGFPLSFAGFRLTSVCPLAPIKSVKNNPVNLRIVVDPSFHIGKRLIDPTCSSGYLTLLIH